MEQLMADKYVLQYLIETGRSMAASGLQAETGFTAAAADGLPAGSLRELMDAKAEKDTAAQAATAAEGREDFSDIMAVVGATELAVEGAELVLGLDLLGFHTSNGLSATLLADGRVSATVRGITVPSVRFILSRGGIAHARRAGAHCLPL
jgi:hypothetical protein